MKKTARALTLAALLPAAALVLGEVTPATSADPPALMLAFSSYRHHVGYPRIYYYHHDGRAAGRLDEGPPPGTDRSDFDPYLTADGTLLAYNTQTVGKEARCALWDVASRQALPLPASPETAVDMGPCVTGDGSRLVLATLFRPGPSGWNLLMQERKNGAAVELPGLNSDEDDRMPSLSADGRRLAFASSRAEGAGLQDIYVYDIPERRLLPLPGLNSPSRETEPCLSADGRWLAFVSTRPPGGAGRAGAGNLDVYLYDLEESALVPLPGLNGPGADQSPALSPDGRFVAFVSERFGADGARDIYLYDRLTARVLPTPGLNSARDDMDPALAGSAAP